MIHVEHTLLIIFITTTIDIAIAIDIAIDMFKCFYCLGFEDV